MLWNKEASDNTHACESKHDCPRADTPTRTHVIECCFEGLLLVWFGVLETESHSTESPSWIGFSSIAQAKLHFQLLISGIAVIAALCLAFEKC